LIRRKERDREVIMSNTDMLIMGAVALVALYLLFGDRLKGGSGTGTVGTEKIATMEAVGF